MKSAFPTVASATYSLVRFITLRLPWLRRIARSLFDEHRARQLLAQDSLREIKPIAARASASKGRRVNLLLPGVSDFQLYGGAMTAIEFLQVVAPDLPKRLLVTDEIGPFEIAPDRFIGWSRRMLGDEDCDGNCLVGCADRAETTLPIRPDDVFIATAWWTAILAQQLVRWQTHQYGRAAPLVYLIQDYEPGFYPWSTRYVLAEQTYRSAVPTIAVFNSTPLRAYFADLGYRFATAFTFEPRLNPVLASELELARNRSRTRQLVIYGRPSVPRNGFPLIIEALRIWCDTEPDAAGWRIVSVGEKHPDIALAPGLNLESLGKLDLQSYARLLAESAIGIALMISPHPSYPPLEMAAFGLRTISNRFGGKDLAEQHRNIVSPRDLSAASLAAKLVELTAAFERHRRGIDTEPWSVADTLFANGSPMFPFKAELRRCWLDAEAG